MATPTKTQQKAEKKDVEKKEKKDVEKKEGDEKKEKKVRAKPVNVAKKCGLTFPAGRFTAQLRKGKYLGRVSMTAGVYLAAVCEYLVSEVLDLSSKAVAQSLKAKEKKAKKAGAAKKDDKDKKVKKTRLTPRAVCLAIRNDPELGSLLQNVTLARGGVVPFVSKALEKKSKKAKKAKKSVKA